MCIDNIRGDPIRLKCRISYDFHVNYFTNYSICLQIIEKAPSPTHINDIETSFTFSDTDDIVVEEEKIVYLNGSTTTENNNAIHNSTTNKLIAKLMNVDLSKDVNTLSTDDEDKDVVIEEETIVYNSDQPETQCESNRNHSCPIASSVDDAQSHENKSIGNEHHQPEKLRYKRKYLKTDPNIIIEFAANEYNMLKALKVLFDWLKVNSEILTNCFVTNPEFIHKIMKLLNYFNIDVFTNKVYFDQSLIRVSSDTMRSNLRSLFDIVGTIPIAEDILLKNFSLLTDVQQNLDWETPLKCAVTEPEQNFLRIFKLVDFGFFMCKMKKFRYNFCARSRRFIETNGGRRKERNNGGKQSRKRSDRRRNFGRLSRPKEEQHRVQNGAAKALLGEHQDNHNGRESDTDECPKTGLPKKSYLKNRSNVVDAKQLGGGEKENVSSSGNKYEIMGKLWLRNEVKTLETKIRKPIAMTPYLVMDSKSLTEYTSIVRYLMKTRKFIILIPTAGE